VPQTMGLIFDIKRFAIHDGPGIRTTVFFKGCPLSCAWCHNPESRSRKPEVMLRATRCVKCMRCVEVCPTGAIVPDGDIPQVDRDRCSRCAVCAEACPTDAREIVGREVSAAEVVGELAKDRVFFDESGGGVTISGGEPLLQPEFLIALLEGCRAEGLHSVVDTTGLAPWETVAQVAERADLILYDLKLADSSRHRRWTGVENDLILDNLRRLSAAGRNVVVRIPLIPGVNDNHAELRAMGGFVATLDTAYPVDLLPYQAMGSEKYARLGMKYELSAVQPPTPDQIEGAAMLLRSCSLTVTVRGEKP
jgi:pyruvate formate lyase activating enzyme